MTYPREQIIAWARESGLHLPYWNDDEDPQKDPPRWTMVSPLPPLLERFAALVAAAEREEIAKMFDEARGAGRTTSCHQAAAAIRARGDAK